MKNFLNSDWLRAVQFFRNTVQKVKFSAKNEIQCKKWNTVQKMKYSAKNEIQCKKVKYSATKWNTVQKVKIIQKNITSDKIF
jgi:2',3'-cyclic-nucleotide 2'-phosphodiesterase (5'-nucleotidase family)